MTTEPLTPARLRTLKPGERVRDSRVTAMYCNGNAGGTASYLLRYRTRAGQERTIKIGRYPDMQLDDARRVARELLMQVAQGKDPKQDWDAARGEPTVADLCERYLTTQQGILAASSLAADTARVRSPRFAAAPLARLRVNAVTLDDANTFLKSVNSRARAPEGKRFGGRWQGKAEAPVAANRYRAMLHRVFELARLDWRLRSKPLGNPFEGSVRYAEHARRRKLSPEEIARTFAALEALAPALPRQCAAIYTLLLTGLRPIEVRTARATWLHGETLIFPDHKTASAIGDKAVPLPAQVLDLLARTGTAPDGYLFSKAVDLRWTWDRVRERAELPGVEMRDLRRTFASIGAKTGKSLTQIGQIFGHTNPQTTKRYAWMFDDDKAQHVQQIADEIARQGNPDKPTSG